MSDNLPNTGTLVLEGYASTWEEDRDGETVAKDAFNATIKTFMTNPILLLNHKKEQVLGGVTYLQPDETGLWIHAEVDKPPEKAEGWAHKAYADIKNQRLKTFSMGGLFHRFKAFGDKIHRVDLYEISVVVVPSNRTSLFRVVAEKGYDGHPIEHLLGGEFKVRELRENEVKHLGFQAAVEKRMAELRFEAAVDERVAVLRRVKQLRQQQADRQTKDVPFPHLRGHGFDR